MVRTTGTVLTVLALSALPVMAAELSPWLGSPDQSPFQLDSITMIAVPLAADPMSTGSLTKPPCQSEGCVKLISPAKTKAAAGSAPQK